MKTRDILLSLAPLLFTTELLATAEINGISQQQVDADIRYLASDELAGRQVTTPGITKAEDYIAGQFAQAGLQPLTSAGGFRQPFSLYQLLPGTMAVTLNGVPVSQDQVAVIADGRQIRWHGESEVELVYITAQDNPQQRMRDINRQGKDVIVIFHLSHRAYFEQFQHYLAKGRYKSALGQKNSAVLILSDQSRIEHFDIEINNRVKQQALANVVGLLPGRSRPEEVVVYSAHHDHIGVDTGQSGDQIYNGANDDASGVTAVLNLARYFGQRGDNERTLMFVTFTAEEIGGFGSQYFSRQMDPSSIVAMLNIEMIGKASKFGAKAMWMTGPERSDLDEILTKNLNGSDFKLYDDPYPDFQLFYRSDNATLARLGVPAHSLSTTQLDNDADYHQVSDEVPSLDTSIITRVTGAIARGSTSIVAGEDTPKRLDTSMVKAPGSLF